MFSYAFFGFDTQAKFIDNKFDCHVYFAVHAEYTCTSVAQKNTSLAYIISRDYEPLDGVFTLGVQVLARKEITLHLCRVCLTNGRVL